MKQFLIDRLPSMQATTCEASGWSPVSEPQRAIGLDTLRGFALFGVLVANTLQFAYPIVSAPPEMETWRGTGVVDRSVLLLVGMLVEGKFYTLLSILFGMGLALQSDRAVASGIPFVGFSLRRAALLFMIGLVHGVCLFAADFLTFYAVLAAAAVFFCRWPACRLMAAAVVSACACVVVLSVYAWSHPERPYPLPLDWSKVTQQGGSADLPPIEGTAVALLENLGVPREDFVGWMENEARISRDGSWLELIRLRVIILILLALPIKTLLLGPMFLAFFLFGMFLIRSAAGATPAQPQALLIRLDDNAVRGYRTWFRVGVPLGLVLLLIGSGVQLALPRMVVTPPIYWTFLFVSVFAQSLGYAGGMLWLTARKPDGRLVRWLRPVGRTALSNYIAQSVLLGFVFYGTGLGFFTRLTALPVVTLALPVFALEIWLSRAWLRRFSMGPVEWAWRSLAYGRWLPIRRPAERTEG
jgi:uncharacterized protein